MKTHFDPRFGEWLVKHGFVGSKAAHKTVDLAASGLPQQFQIVGCSEEFQIQAAGDGAASKLRRFSMTAYTGGAMRLPGYGLPVVVDLAGMKVPSQRRPILRQHDPERPVAHSDQIEITQQRLKLAGVISGVGPAAQEIVAMADNGFPWQSSIGASVDSMEYLDKGANAKVNGRSFTGPLYIARQTVLGEVSFVPIGADGQSSASIA